MRVRLFSCFVCLSLLLSCSKDENEYHPLAEKLQGKWENGDKVNIYSAPIDSTVEYYQNGNLYHTEKYYLHPKTGKIWLRNIHYNDSRGWVYTEMYSVEFNDDYSIATIQGIPYNRK